MDDLNRQAQHQSDEPKEHSNTETRHLIPPVRFRQRVDAAPGYRRVAWEDRKDVVRVESMVRLMWGARLPGREGGLLNARLRYFDPDRKRAGPEDVAALVSELSDARTVVTLIN